MVASSWPAGTISPSLKLTDSKGPSMRDLTVTVVAETCLDRSSNGVGARVRTVPALLHRWKASQVGTNWLRGFLPDLLAAPRANIGRAVADR